jgi:hypothetical protein
MATTTKKARKPAAGKAKATRPKKAPAKKLSQIQAAIRVLTEAGQPMTAKAMVEAMQAKGYWTSPAGRTPEATLYASIIRDIRKGKDARFVKTGRGTFALAAKK